ncbi:hypothetical protein FRB93_008112 [Tulasnella sp. JGI-2019a]|nr:hypothetical protein FRB93_008112 [Tulasnella sp. JGI-2019a]
MAPQARSPAYRVLGFIFFTSLLFVTVYIAFETRLDFGSRFHIQPRNNSKTELQSSRHPVDIYVPQQDVAQAPVVITMVMIGETSAVEGLGALKSVFMYLSRPLELHLVCSSDVPEIVDRKMALISRPTYNVRVSYYVLDPEMIRDRATRAGIGTKHQAGLGGLAKVFLHEILFNVPRTIYFDTDMAFLVDPVLLWKEFDHLTGEKMISFPIQSLEAGPEKICSCVMLLDLQQMRRRIFMPSTSFPPSTATLGSPDTWASAPLDPQDPQMGDQGIYWAIWRKYPHHFVPLSLSWDVTHCHWSWGLGLAQGDDSITEAEHIDMQTEVSTAAPERFGQIFPGILHFNCQGFTDIVWEDADNLRRPRWAPFVWVIRQYKWVWFNRGDGTATVNTKIVNARHFHDDVMFARPATNSVRKPGWKGKHGKGSKKLPVQLS